MMRSVRSVQRGLGLMAWAALVALTLLLGGCGNVGYYLQSASGQIDIWRRETPIAQVLQDPTAPPQLKAQLLLVQRLRDFASAELALPNNRSYRSYADLGRPFVVWNVYAAPELSLEPLQWCFVLAGCVNYRGYFNEAEARAHARELAATGNDVYVGGVPAYSTIGWFADPVLNTFIHYPEPELARLLFHELAHQVVYVQDDTVFNESFATAVEHAGVARWLALHGSEADRARVAQLQRFRAGFGQLLTQAREELAAVYAGSGTEADKRQRKAAVYAGLRQSYEAQRQAWGGFAGYDRWFAQPLGNAHLASVAIYTQQVPAFEALLAQNGGDLPQFYAAVKALAALPADERKLRLAALGATAVQLQAVQ